MPLNGNSYSSVAEVLALTRLYLGGQSTFNSTTRPTLTEVESFIDDVSGELNLALGNAGFTIPITQNDAKSACDNWVKVKAAAFVEASRPTAAFGKDTNPRASLLAKMNASAAAWVKENMKGFAVLGVPQVGDDSNALIFTALDAQSLRSDPTDTSREQPKFKRGQFDS